MTLGDTWNLFCFHYKKTSGFNAIAYEELRPDFRAAWVIFIKDLVRRLEPLPPSDHLVRMAQLQGSLEGCQQALKIEMQERSLAICERDKALAEIDRLKKKHAEEMRGRSPNRVTSKCGTYERLDYIRIPLTPEDILQQPAYGSELPILVSDDVERESVNEALSAGEPQETPTMGHLFSKLRKV